MKQFFSIMASAWFSAGVAWVSATPNPTPTPKVNMIHVLKHKHSSTTTECVHDCNVYAYSPTMDCATVTPTLTVGEMYCLDQSHYIVCQAGFGPQEAEEVMWGDMCWTGAVTKKRGKGKMTYATGPLPGQTGQTKGYILPTGK